MGYSPRVAKSQTRLSDFTFIEQTMAVSVQEQVCICANISTYMCPLQADAMDPASDQDLTHQLRHSQDRRTCRVSSAHVSFP